MPCWSTLRNFAIGAQCGTNKAMVTKRAKPRPLDQARLDELGLAYVARFATSAAKCADYLRRKLRERGWAGDGDPQIDALVERLRQSGYIDDAVFAAAKAGGLLRRGFGSRRIAQALHHAGIAEETRQAVLPARDAERLAALALAQKRRFGPFGAVLPDRPVREKQIAAMLRAGHRLDSARRLVDATSVEFAENWARQEDD
jgi:regulatory protein